MQSNSSATTIYHIDWYPLIFQGIATAWQSLWWFWLLVAMVMIVRFLFYLNHLDQLRKARIFEIDKMSGEEFEKFLEQLFLKLGYKVQRIGMVNDMGVDLIIEKFGKRTAVQSKRYKNRVGEDAVREVSAGKNYYHCSEAMVVTNSRYSRQAVRLAHANQVWLWGRRELTKRILQTKS